jgi:hypothetical protein
VGPAATDRRCFRKTKASVAAAGPIRYVLEACCAATETTRVRLQYVCFKDCNDFPDDWKLRCRDACDREDCEPPEFQFNAAAAPLLSSFVVAVAGAALLARWW